MKHTYRKFLADDIPISIRGGIPVFDWAEFENKLHVNIGQSMYVNIIKIVQNVIDELYPTEFFNERSLKVNIAVRLTTNFYPLYCGIKEDSKVNQEYELKYINIDDLLSETQLKTAGEITAQLKSEGKDIESYMVLLIDKYGFSFQAAKDIVLKKNFNLDAVMDIIKKTSNQIEDKTREDILKDAIKRFTK
jgi:hypothetical protein